MNHLGTNTTASLAAVKTPFTPVWEHFKTAISRDSKISLLQRGSHLLNGLAQLIKAIFQSILKSFESSENRLKSAVVLEASPHSSSSSRSTPPHPSSLSESQPRTELEIKTDESDSQEQNSSSSSSSPETHRVVNRGNETRVVTEDLEIVVKTTKVPGENRYYAQVAVAPKTTEEVEVCSSDFVFCIDVSGSMQLPMDYRGGRPDFDPTGRDSRLGEVKKVLNEFLNQAEITLKDNPNSKIGFSLVQFNHEASAIQSATQLNLENLRQIRQLVQELNPSGNTAIAAGLDESAKQASEMARVNGAAARALVFLTDGEDDSLNQDQLKAIQERLMESSVSLFALGVSAGHRAATMQMVIQNHMTGSGNYPNAQYEWIDESVQLPMEGKTTLSNAIQSIFAQTYARWMHNVTIHSTTPQADLIGFNMAQRDGKLLIGGIPFGATATKVVQLLSQGDRLNLHLTYQVDDVTKEENLLIPLSDIEDSTVRIAALKEEVITLLARLPLTYNKDDQDLLLKQANDLMALFGEDPQLQELKQMIEDCKNSTERENQLRAACSKLSNGGRYAYHMMSRPPQFPGQL